MIDKIKILEQNISNYNFHEIVKINVMFTDNRSCRYVRLTATYFWIDDGRKCMTDSSIIFFFILSICYSMYASFNCIHPFTFTSFTCSRSFVYCSYEDQCLLSLILFVAFLLSNISTKNLRFYCSCLSYIYGLRLGKFMFTSFTFSSRIVVRNVHTYLCHR
jgi:hypothetical protein